MKEIILNADEKHNSAEKDVLDVLLDENNSELLELVDEEGKHILFEQVAIIPLYDKGKLALYAILAPKEHISGISEDEALVFAVIENEQHIHTLSLETDDSVAEKVFGEYFRLLSEVWEDKN